MCCMLVTEVLYSFAPMVSVALGPVVLKICNLRWLVTTIKNIAGGLICLQHFDTCAQVHVPHFRVGISSRNQDDEVSNHCIPDRRGSSSSSSFGQPSVNPAAV